VVAIMGQYPNQVLDLTKQRRIRTIFRVSAISPTSTGTRGGITCDQLRFDVQVG